MPEGIIFAVIYRDRGKKAPLFNRYLCNKAQTQAWWVRIQASSDSIIRNEMAEWHHWLDGRESEWTPGVGDGQRGLACCDSWGRKESDTTERLNWADIIFLHPTIWHCSMFRAHINNASMKNFCTYLENICFYPRYRSKSRIEGNVWDQL